MGSGRLAVVLAASSTAVHLSLAGRATSTDAFLALVAMGGACLVCVPSLWRGGSLHSWMTMLGLTGAMLFAHLELCFSCGTSVHGDSSLANHLFLQGLGSAALWLMLGEMTLAGTAVVRLLQTTQHHNPEVVPS